MTKTKKVFLKAGSILAIVSSIFMALLGFIFIPSAALISEDFIIDTYTTEIGYTKYIAEDGSYYIEYYEDEEDYALGIKQKVTEEDIELIATVSKTLLIVAAVLCIGFGIAEFVIGLLLLIKTNKDKTSKPLIITLLVFSVLTGSMLILAFMIVALCLKDKPKVTLENVNEIANNEQ